MTNIIAELSVVVNASVVSHPPIEHMTEEEKKFLGITETETK